MTSFGWNSDPVRLLIKYLNSLNLFFGKTKTELSWIIIFKLLLNP